LILAAVGHAAAVAALMFIALAQEVARDVTA
jgi:hypothetical protein